MHHADTNAQIARLHHHEAIRAAHRVVTEPREQPAGTPRRQRTRHWPLHHEFWSARP